MTKKKKELKCKICNHTPAYGLTHSEKGEHYCGRACEAMDGWGHFKCRSCGELDYIRASFCKDGYLGEASEPVRRFVCGKCGNDTWLHHPHTYGY